MNLVVDIIGVACAVDSVVTCLIHKLMLLYFGFIPVSGSPTVNILEVFITVVGLTYLVVRVGIGVKGVRMARGERQ